MTSPREGSGEPPESFPEDAPAATHNEFRADVHGLVVQARDIHGGVNYVQKRAEPPKPAQLPPPPPHFTGRSEELTFLDEAFAPGSAPVAVLVGPGGVGKTSIALHWLHARRESLTDGLLYGDLTATPDGSPRDPGVVLSGFLRALGVAAEDVPLEIGEQAALYRSVTSGRRLAVLLESPVSAAQVRPLVPGPPHGITLVTSRHRIAGLAVDGARFADVRPLSEAGAAEMLRQLLGEQRISAELEAARVLGLLCGRMPIALSASAARLIARPAWRVERLVAELRDERRRLAALHIDEEVSVRSTFDTSYRALSEPAKRLYRLLGLHPCAGFSTASAAAIAGIPRESAETLLGELMDATLIGEAGEDRHQFHDLIRLHARHVAVTGDPGESDDAIGRIIRWYLDAAVDADRVVLPGRWHLGPAYARPPATVFSSGTDALDWLEAQLPDLLAVLTYAHDQGRQAEAWQLGEALWGLFFFRRHYGEWRSAHLTAIAAAQACGDVRAEARLEVQLGLAYLNLERHEEAHGHFTRALTLDAGDGHRIGEATALDNLGLAEAALGRKGSALERFGGARAIFEELRDPRGIALMSRRIGDVQRDLGRFDEAIGTLVTAMAAFTEQNDGYNRARTATSLAQVHLSAGRPEAAEPLLREALTTMRDLGSRYEEARVHVCLAEAVSGPGRRDEARAHLGLAREIYAGMDDPGVGVVDARLRMLDEEG